MPDEPTYHTPEALKALSHPLRRKILRQLATHGPATSTTIGEALDQNTGTTSYHLRQLAQAGFIAEITEKAKGRERWWRTVPADRRMPPPDQMSKQDLSAAGKLILERAAEDLDVLATQLATDDQTGDWLQGSRGGGFMTSEELQSFHDEYLRLLRKYSHSAETAADGSRRIAVRWYAFPDQV